MTLKGLMQLLMNQCLVTAIAEKISALKTETYFHKRQAQGNLIAFDNWLAACPEVNPLAGYELP